MASSIPSCDFDDVRTTVNDIVRSYMEKFSGIWADCGYNDISIQQRCDAVKKHVQTLFDEMLEEEQENKNVVITKVEDYLKEIADLSKDLAMEIPVTGYENLPLCNVERTLRYKVEEYRKIKDSRLHRLTELEKKEKLLCDALGIPTQADFRNQVPSEQQLDEFEVYIQEKNDEKERLMQVYHESKYAIISVMTELEIVPTLEFERLVCGKDVAFRPTRENMTALRQLHQRLEHQLEDTKAEATELREKLTHLWDRLHKAYMYRDEFLGTHRGHSATTLKALKDELKICEEEKRQKIKEFVEDCRKELKDWWDKCLVGEEERLEFRPLSSECFTEDLLELHELEVQKLKNYYKQNGMIFELANERQQLWDNMLELDNRANDPNRLFQNRGGQLLVEEKERKVIQKKLPKCERELMKHIALYEEQHKKPFKIHGESIVDIINNQRELFENHKEREKKAKKFARDRLLEVESKLGSQSRASKRKNVPGTPVHSSTKLRKVNGNDRTAALENHRPNQRNAVPRNIFPETGSNSESSAASNLTTYTDFQDHLEVLNQEGTCRSSVVPGRCLRERNTPARTPSKIPSKILPSHSMKKTPQPRVTPMKPPRKNVAGQTSSSKLPRTVPRTVRGTPSSPMYQRGMATTPG